MINEKTYYNLKENEHDSSTWENGEYYLRFDSVSQCYYSIIPNQEEHLLYDFSVMTGDTVAVYSNHSYTTLIVHDVDSVFVEPINRKRIRFENTDEYWIEGIGSTAGLLNPGWGLSTGIGYELLCYFENDIVKYHNENYSDCDINTNKKLIINDNKYVLYPNPTKDKLYIESPCLKYKIEIIDSKGKTIYSKKNVCQNEICIKTGFMSNGTYIVRLINDSDIQIRKLIIF